jgi:hypothetical protein
MDVTRHGYMKLEEKQEGDKEGGQKSDGSCK